MAFAPTFPRTLPLSPGLPAWARPRHVRREIGRLAAAPVGALKRILAKSVTVSAVTNGTGLVASGSSVATGSITPSANSMLLIQVQSGIVFVTPNTPTLSGGGLTYNAARAPDVWSFFIKTSTWLASCGATPGTFAITADFATQSQTGGANIVAVELTSGMGASPLVQSAFAGNASTAPAVTLAAFASSANATVALINTPAGSTSFTAGSGFTRLANDVTNGCFSEWRSDNDTSVDGTLGTSNTWGVTAFEIQASVSATLAAAVASASAAGKDAAMMAVSAIVGVVANATAAAQAALLSASAFFAASSPPSATADGKNATFTFNASIFGQVASATASGLAGAMGTSAKLLAVVVSATAAGLAAAFRTLSGTDINHAYTKHVRPALRRVRAVLGRRVRP